MKNSIYKNSSLLINFSTLMLHNPLKGINDILMIYKCPKHFKIKTKKKVNKNHL